MNAVNKKENQVVLVAMFLAVVYFVIQTFRKRASDNPEDNYIALNEIEEVASIPPSAIADKANQLPASQKYFKTGENIKLRSGWNMRSDDGKYSVLKQSDGTEEVTIQKIVANLSIDGTKGTWVKVSEYTYPFFRKNYWVFIAALR